MSFVDILVIAITIIIGGLFVGGMGMRTPNLLF